MYKWISPIDWTLSQVLYITINIFTCVYICTLYTSCNGDVIMCINFCSYGPMCYECVCILPPSPLPPPRPGHAMPVRSLCFSPDSKLLVTASDDKDMKIYDVYALACIAVSQLGLHVYHESFTETIFHGLTPKTELFARF